MLAVCNWPLTLQLVALKLPWNKEQKPTKILADSDETVQSDLWTGLKMYFLTGNITTSCEKMNFYIP